MSEVLMLTSEGRRRLIKALSRIVQRENESGKAK